MLPHETSPGFRLYASHKHLATADGSAYVNAGQSMITELCLGAWWWMPEPGSDVIFLPVCVKEVDRRSCCVLLESEAGEQWTVAAEEMVHWDKASLSNLSLVDDLTRTHGGAGHRVVLNQLRRRFQKDLPYVWVGDILLFMKRQNGLPEFFMPEEALPYCMQGKQNEDLPVHIYELADITHQAAVSHNGGDQSILIMGEHGAGKSDVLKLSLGFLEQARRSESTGYRLVKALEVLEIFGGAHIGHDESTSCFGQQWVLEYASDGCIKSARVRACLLEKSRVTFRLPGESNFHIFQCLCAGVDQAMRLSLQLPQRPKLLVGSKKCKGSGHSDSVHDFRLLCESLGSLGFSEDELGALLRSVSAVLALGELDFQTTASASSGRRSSMPSSRTSCATGCMLTNEALPALEAFAVLAGCDANAARRALTVCDIGARGAGTQSSHTDQDYLRDDTGDTKSARLGHYSQSTREKDVRPPRPGKPSVELPLTCMQASQARDTLCRALYMQIFDYLVSAISDKLQVLPSGGHETGDADSADGCEDVEDHAIRAGVIPLSSVLLDSVGGGSRTPDASRVHIVNFVGFEYSQANSLEQFCANYINEWLHGIFLMHFLEEVQHHANEGLALDGIILDDNCDCVMHLQDVLCLLDEATLAQSGSDISFLESLQQSSTDSTSGIPLHQSFRVVPPSRIFEVRHYAASITYDATGWVAMNRDHLTPGVRELVQGLGNPVFSHCAGVQQAEPTQVSSLQAQLSEVTSSLDSSRRRYIWCIRPNRCVSQDLGDTRVFDGTAVLGQLQTSGLLDVINLGRIGYPHKLSVVDFIARYGSLMPKACTASELVDAARRVGEFAPDAIRIKDGLIIFRHDVLEELELMCQSLRQASAVRIQTAWRRHRVCAERRAYVGSFMSVPVTVPDPGQALQEVEDLLLQLRVCPPPRFFDISILERRFQVEAEARRTLLQSAIEIVAAKAVAAAASVESPGDVAADQLRETLAAYHQLHETLRQHIMVAHRFRVPVEREAEACLKRFKEWEQTQQLDASLGTLLPLLQGGASLHEVQEAISMLAQTPLWQTYGSEAAEQAILEPCLREMGIWADSRVSILIDGTVDKAEDDNCTPRTTDNHLKVLSKRLQELEGLQHLLGTLKEVPPLQHNAAAEMQRLHEARIRAASRALVKAMESGSPTDVDIKLKYICTVFSQATSRADSGSDRFDLCMAEASASDKYVMQLLPSDIQYKVSDGIHQRLADHCQEIRALSADCQDFGMVPESWLEELQNWIKLSDQVINEWNLLKCPLYEMFQHAQGVLDQYHEWQHLQVEHEFKDLLSGEPSFRGGPAHFDEILKECNRSLRERLGDKLGSDETSRVLRSAARGAVVKHLLRLVEAAPTPVSSDAEATPAELAVFHELLPWWIYALDNGYADHPESSSALVCIIRFTRRCTERLEQSDVEVAMAHFCSEIAKAELGPAMEALLSSHSAALSAKLQEAFASSLTPEQCAEKLRTGAAPVLATRVEEAINFVVGQFTTWEPATADDAWLNYLGLEIGGGRFMNVSFQAVHVLKTCLKQWVSWGGVDHDLAARAQEALDTCRDWAIVEMWISARESVKPLVEAALQKGLDRLKPEVQKLADDLVTDLGTEKSQAATKLDILVVLEGAVHTRKLLSEINALIDVAMDSDGLTAIPGIRHFGHVSRPLIAQLRRAVQLLSTHPAEVAESVTPCLMGAQEMLADFVRWQPYARWVESLAGLAHTAAAPGPLADLCADAQRAIEDCRPASLPEGEAKVQLQNVLQEALAQRWEGLSKRVAEVVPPPTDVSEEGHATVAAPPLHRDIDELQVLHAFFEHDAPKLGLSCPDWHQEVLVKLDAVVAWESQRTAEQLNAELVQVIRDKTLAQVLSNVRQTRAVLMSLGWAEDKVGDFIGDHSEIPLALGQRISRACEEMCKWTRQKSARRTPRTPRMPSTVTSPRGTPSSLISPRRTPASAASPRRNASLFPGRPGLLQCAIKALMDAPSFRWTSALRTSAGELDFAGVPASVVRELQGWKQVADLCGFKSTHIEASSGADARRSCSAVANCNILLFQREFCRVQSTLREALTELRRSVVEATSPEFEDFRRKCRLATRTIRMTLSTLQKALADFGAAGAAAHGDRAPELATCSLEGHVECCVAQYLLEVACEEQLVCHINEFERVMSPLPPSAPSPQSARHTKRFATVVSSSTRLADVIGMLNAWLAFAEEQQQLIIGTSMHDVRRHLSFGSYDVSEGAKSGSTGALSGVPAVLAACREALECAKGERESLEHSKNEQAPRDTMQTLPIADAEEEERNDASNQSAVGMPAHVNVAQASKQSQVEMLAEVNLAQASKHGQVGILAEVGSQTDSPIRVLSAENAAVAGRAFVATHEEVANQVLACIDESSFDLPTDVDEGPLLSPREGARLRAADLEVESAALTASTAGIEPLYIDEGGAAAVDIEGINGANLASPVNTVEESTPSLTEDAQSQAAEIEIHRQALYSIRTRWHPELYRIDTHEASDLEFFINQIRDGLTNQLDEIPRSIDEQLITCELAEFDQIVLDMLVTRVAKQTSQLQASVSSQNPSTLLLKLQMDYGLTRELLELPLCEPSGDRYLVGDVLALPPFSFGAVPLGVADDLRLILLVTEEEFRRAGMSDAHSNTTLIAASNLLQAELTWQRSSLQHDYRRRLAEIVLYQNAAPAMAVVKDLAMDLDQSLLEIGLGSDARTQEMELFDATAAALLLRQVQASLESLPGIADSHAYFSQIGTLQQLVRCLGPGGPWPAASAYGALRRTWPSKGEAATVLAQAEDRFAQARDKHRNHIKQEADAQLEQCLCTAVRSKAALELPDKPTRRSTEICPAFVNSSLPTCSPKSLWIQVLGEVVTERLLAHMREFQSNDGSPQQWLEFEILSGAASELRGIQADEDDTGMSDIVPDEVFRFAEELLQKRDTERRRSSWRIAEDHVRLEYSKRGARELHTILEEAEARLEESTMHPDGSRTTSHWVRWQSFVSKFVCLQLEAVLMDADRSSDEVRSADLRSDLQHLLSMANEQKCSGSIVDESQRLLKVLTENGDRSDVESRKPKEKAAMAASLGARSAARLAVGRLANDHPRLPEQPRSASSEDHPRLPEQARSASSEAILLINQDVAKSPAIASARKGQPHSSRPWSATLRGEQPRSTSPRRSSPRSVSPLGLSGVKSAGKSVPSQRSTTSVKASRAQSTGHRTQPQPSAQSPARSGGHGRPSTTSRVAPAARASPAISVVQSHRALERAATRKIERLLAGIR